MDDKILFLEGIRQFNSHDFFKAHDVWEKGWITAKEEKKFLQGLIQISVGFYHYNHSNIDGALMLLERGVSYIETYPKDYFGVEVDDLIEKIKETLGQIKNREKFNFPQIHLIR
jgi:predicted metal-dependent hydrolase